MITREEWETACDAACTHAKDRMAVECTLALREHIFSMVASEPTSRDLIHAWMRLGHELVALGASPVLGPAIVHALATQPGSTRWADSAMTAVCEANARWIAEDVRSKTLAAWASPLVHLGKDEVAIAANFEGDDAGEWIDTLSANLAEEGIRRALVEGPAAARMRESLQCVGIDARVIGEHGK